MPKNKKMGRAIREAREQNALTQEDLAKRMNVSQGTVSNWERGHEPDKQTQAKLKSILGQTVRSPATGFRRHFNCLRMAVKSQAGC